MFAAERVVPSITTDGIPTPTGTSARFAASGTARAIRPTSRDVAATTASGVDGLGVATR